MTDLPKSVPPPGVAGGRDAALDGIRGFAALAVVSAHLVVYLGLLPFTPMGAMGVVMFFALSGYLIAGICWRRAPSWSSYRSFLRRRVVRLGPVVVALVLLGGPVLVRFGDVPPTDGARSGVFVLSQTTAFASALADDVIVPFRPAWSLTVEWAFYLLFPVLLMGLRRSGAEARTAWRAMAGLAVGLYVVGLALPADVFYLLPVANLGVLFAGAALATWHRGRPVASGPVDPAYGLMAMLMLSVLVVLPGHSIGWGWKAAVFPAAAISTLVVLHSCWSGGLLARLLSVLPLRAVGLRAYSLYLWHVPVMWVVWITMPASSAGVQVLVALSATAVVVWASFEVLERPVLRGRGAGVEVAQPSVRLNSDQLDVDSTSRQPS